VAYIAGLVVVGLFFLAMHYFTELTRSQKTVVTGVVLFIVLFAIAFNKYNDAKTQKMLDAVLKFNQNKTIICDGTRVNKENFTLSIGTYTFIGKENTPNRAQMISASKCE
jgi:energy-coupling factor transporter transmembrane protein EcfT